MTQKGAMIAVMTSCMVMVGACHSPEAPLADSASLSSTDPARKTLAPVADAMGLNLEAPVELDRVERSTATGKQVRTLLFRDGERVDIDQESGKLQYYRSGAERNVPKNLSLSDAISKEAAIAKTVEFALSVGRDLDTDECEAHLRPGGDPQEPTLAGARWSVNVEYHYQGIPCLGKGFYANASAYSGEVLAFHDVSIVEPESLEQNISSEEAASAARKFVANQYAADSPSSKDEPLLVIVQPNHWWTDKRTAFFEGPSRLCWAVRIELDSDGTENVRSPILVFVACDTGEIVGGLE